MPNALRETLERMKHPKLLVAGDILLDRYITGAAERVSPEAPVIVLNAESDEVRPGGAASVAAFLRGLEADVILAGVTGDDPPGHTIRQLCREAGIDARLVLTDEDRPTTTKERILGSAWQRPGQQMLRVDHESRAPLAETLADQLAESIIARLDEVAAVLISDYGKGVCTPRLLSRVIAAAQQKGVPVLVDPARGVPLERYRGASLLKANRAEAELLLTHPAGRPEEAARNAEEIRVNAGLPTVVVTLDQDGCVLAREGAAPLVFRTLARTVCDVTGAGDLFLAMLGLGTASGLSTTDLLPLANLAAGLEVERQGVAPVTRDELRQALSLAGRTAQDKWVALDQAAQLADRYRESGQRIVFTNGCFDLLHAGHIRCLQEAAQEGDVLFVAVNSDASVKRIKGESRPVYPEQDRLALLSALACVDHVLLLEEDTPHRLLHRLRPDVLVKGGTTQEVVCRSLVEQLGGRVVVTSAVPGVSTTDIVQHIRAPETSHVASHSH